MTTIAIIGAGAMGSGLGWRIAQHGADVLTLLDGRSEATRARAAKAGMREASLGEIGQAAMILSVVPPAQAAAVVEMLVPVFASGSAPLFCDANALAPETKRQLANRVGELGGRMIDGSIIGGPPSPTYESPRLYVCGAGAEEIARLNDFGIDTRVLDGPLGAAAALKMCYGGINKGITALTTAMLLAAQRHGAAEDLRAEFGISQEWLLERSRRTIPDMYPKAYRWEAEMAEISAFLIDDDPAAAKIWAGMAEFYAGRARANETGEELPGLVGLLK